MTNLVDLEATWHRLHNSNDIVQPHQGNDIDTFRLGSQGLWIGQPLGLLGSLFGTDVSTPRSDVTERLNDDELALSALSFVASVFAKYLVDGQIYLASRDNNAEKLNAASWPAFIQSAGAGRSERQHFYQFDESLSNNDWYLIFCSSRRIARELLKRIALTTSCRQPIPDSLVRLQAVFLSGQIDLPQKSTPPIRWNIVIP